MTHYVKNDLCVGFYDEHLIMDFDIEIVDANLAKIKVHTMFMQSNGTGGDATDIEINVQIQGKAEPLPEWYFFDSKYLRFLFDDKVAFIRDHEVAKHFGAKHYDRIFGTVENISIKLQRERVIEKQ